MLCRFAGRGARRAGLHLAKQREKSLFSSFGYIVPKHFGMAGYGFLNKQAALKNKQKRIGKKYLVSHEWFVLYLNYTVDNAGLHHLFQRKNNYSKHLQSVFRLTYLKLWPNADTYSFLLMWKGDTHAFSWAYAHTNAWPQGEDERLEGEAAHMWVKIQPIPASLQISRLVVVEASTWGQVQPLNTFYKRSKMSTNEGNLQIHSCILKVQTIKLKWNLHAYHHLECQHSNKDLAYSNFSAVCVTLSSIYAFDNYGSWV